MKFSAINNSFKKCSLIVLVFFVSLLLFTSSIPIVSAAGEEYSLFFRDNAGVKRSIDQAWSTGDEYDMSGWSELSVLTAGGIWGNKVFNFDEEMTLKFARKGSIINQTDSRKPLFTLRYFCSKDDGQNKISFSRPGDNEAYYEILYGIRFGEGSFGDDGSKFVGASRIEKSNTAAGPISVKSIRLEGEGSGAYNNYPGTTVYDIANYDTAAALGHSPQSGHNQNGAQGAFGIGDSNKGCRPPHGEIDLPFFNKLSAANKRKFEKSEKEAATNGPNPEDKIDCDATINSPLSWIACPLIDLGVGMTDSVFEKIVVPLLENVPITAKATDGSYRAWQQFRLIANILLVGSLLVIVYSQARGGK